ncbi:hypothetical protein PHSC3_000902 [Chlamydiales bacterium STE3]|nr:hypothetical protein PHSC3_000902 [Chlamydiales bacterium STE3]
MFVSLENWCRYLAQVTSDNSASHSWICEVQRYRNSKIAVLSTKEYDNFFEKNSRWDNCRRKLSFQEIISISKDLISQVAQADDSRTNPYKKATKIDAASGIKKLLRLTDIFSIDMEGRVTQELKQMKATVDTLQLTPTALEKIYQRSRNKRLAEKTRSIWGKLKWYIWACFFDKGSQVKEIKASIPSLSDAYFTAKKTIRKRILLNIDSFEEEINVSENERNFSSDTKAFDKFDSPHKVKKIWLNKYAEDKYRGPITEDAETYRKRIMAMLKIWELINKFESNQSNSESDISNSRPTPLL